MGLARYWLVVPFALLAVAFVARAEGSAEFDRADVAQSRAHDQAVDEETVAYVDILDGNNEKICVRSNGAAISVHRPKPDELMIVGTLGNRDCVDAVDGIRGAYVLSLGTQAVGTEWDIRVCPKSAGDSDCLDDDANERLGRLWSYDWSFQSNTNFGEPYSVNGSVYAIVPGGAADHDAVIEMQMLGVSGAHYHLYANSYGPETGDGRRIGRSTRATQGDQVRPEFPIYLNPPEVAHYNWIQPVVSNVKVEPACGVAVVPDVAPGSISFQSNVVGQYVVICDVSRDEVYDFASDADFSSFGNALVGVNTVSWDGKTKGGDSAAAGDYKCVIRLNVGEFHFLAQDIETSFPGIRMFRLEKDKTSRTDIRMYWDDSLVPEDTSAMPNMQWSPRGSPPAGLSPGAYADAPSPYYISNAMPAGNARAWGQFDSDSKGNDAFLDQFTSAATAESAPITISVIGGDSDPDEDGLTTQRECELQSDPYNPDTDGDHILDGFEASSTTAPNSDGDALIDILDADDDGDGLPTAEELGKNENKDGNPGDALDTDGDGTPDYLDTDSDGDGVADGDDNAPTDRTRCRDADDDTCDDCSGGQGADTQADGEDSDADGICDAASMDADGDGVSDADDLDIDNDGIPNSAEGDGDTDNDGIPNVRDLDSDGDGLPDILEAGGGSWDEDHDGRIDNVEDTGPMDGLHDPLQQDGASLPLPDTDGDGTPDFLDLDSDDDGLFDSQEGGSPDLDRDADGRLDDDKDDNHNGLSDAVDPADSLKEPGQPLSAPDTDGDGTPDYRDPDDDGDGRSTLDERDDAERFADELGGDTDAADVDGDGQPNWQDDDSDGDGVSDTLENMGDGDSNDDDIPDYLQPDVADSDGDGVPDAEEKPDGDERDTDGDGTPDYLDTDDDGDGIPTRDERPDGQDIDTDGDGLANHLDPDDDGDGIPTERESQDKNRDGTPDYLQPPSGTLVGGARCSVTGPGAVDPRASNLFVLGLLLVLLTLWRAHSLWPFFVFWVCVLSPGVVRAQVALDQFKPAPLASDGFGVARPDVSGNMVLGSSLWLDYANDPLAYENIVGDSSSQERVVSTHLVLHAGVSLGLGERLAVFALLPVHLVMTGDEPLSLPAIAPEGAGLGDIALGGRVLLLGDSTTLAALSGEFIARLPTAELANRDQLYSGDAVGSYEPAVIGEVRTGPFDVRARGGIRLRKPRQVGNLDLDQELVFGLGARWRATQLLSVHAEVYGSSFFKKLFGREHTPVELLVGVKAHPGDMSLGLAAGPGLFQGYGSPDLRIVGMVAYAPQRTVAADSDGDGLRDPDDRCPEQPEDHDSFEDADGCPDPDNDRDGVLDTLDKCPSEPEDRDSFEDDDGCPDLDNDRDGLADTQDKCPNDPEDFDGFEDDDGCAEEGAGLVKLTCDKIEIKEAVYFETGSDVIEARSHALLDQVATVLQQARQLKRVRVEGHTDNRGAPEFNLDLSKRRAASVLRYLTQHGVPSERLESEGYGLTQPIADNATEEGRATNRRVDFKVLEQSSQCE